jgi:16S rRNA C967 or C1407 C5-methylase (RsmB/RsmF family)/NOL1/NOP2/fmu family ribosome biogenesis protein
MSEKVKLPLDFIDRIKAEDFYPKQLLDALESDSPVSIRQHPKKAKHNFEVKTQISWCENGFYLNERPIYTLDPLFHAGCYYPQEAGSMNLDGILRQMKLPESPIILDLCAAPGGKSTLIASFLDGKGLLVANEPIPNRASILKENLTKWGYSNTLVLCNKPSDYQNLPFQFDVIAVDAPCSGEGMFRKDKNARSEWSIENADMCANRQKDILNDIWPSLAENGYLIYSTCTFNASENEEIVTFLEKEHSAKLVNLRVDETLISGRDNKGHYCIPGKSESEGFYFVVVQKIDNNRSSKLKFKAKSTIYKLRDVILPFVNITNETEILLWENKLFAVPKIFTQHFLQAQAFMRIVKFGCELGEIAKKGLIPNEALALVCDLGILEKSNIDLDKNTALSYLKGDAIKVDGALGWLTVSYQNQTLGWINNLGNRSNNIYPKQWRIRMKI